MFFWHSASLPNMRHAAQTTPAIYAIVMPLYGIEVSMNSVVFCVFCQKAGQPPQLSHCGYRMLLGCFEVTDVSQLASNCFNGG